MNFSRIIPQYLPLFFEGVKMTILLTLASVFVGLIFGLIAALMKMSKIRVLRVISTAYIEIIRGTPLLVQIFLIYFGITQVTGLNIPEFPAAVIALAINSGAYVAEIIRAGIQAVDRGQTEAAYSLGMPHAMTMRYIVIPQAIKNILPALVNEFITLIKESSVMSVIGLVELTRTSDLIRAKTYLSFEPLLVIALFYFIMTFSLSKLMGVVEKRMKKSDYR